MRCPDFLSCRGSSIRRQEDDHPILQIIQDHLSFDEAAIYDSLLRDYAVPLPLPAIKESLLQSSSGGLTELFSKALLKNPSDFAKGVFLAVAQKRMEDARKEVLDICYDKAAVTLAGMTGLGMGLTPSGDDFLCGVLAGLLFSGQWDHPFAQALRQTISRRLGDTNDISRTFLSCALSCHFSRPVKELPLASGTTEILSRLEQSDILPGLTLFAESTMDTPFASAKKMYLESK